MAERDDSSGRHQGAAPMRGGREVQSSLNGTGKGGKEPLIATFQNHPHLYRAAYAAHRRAMSLSPHFNQRLAQVRGLLRSEFDQFTESFGPFLDLLAQLHQASMTTVAFSAFALEGYINDYAIRKSSKSYFDNYLDKLSPVAKWVIVPRLFNGGKALDTGSKALELLKRLFTHRDRIVHPKPRYKDLEHIFRDEVHTLRQSSDAIEAVRVATQALLLIDPAADVQWVVEMEEEEEHTSRVVSGTE